MVTKSRGLLASLPACLPPPRAMDSAVAVGGHGGGLPLQGPGARKEWRVVNESSGRERLVGDGSGSHQARLSAAAVRSRSNSGASSSRRSTSRNGQMFHHHPSGSGHSSDSDHHAGDIGGTHFPGASLAPQELLPQTIGQGDEAVLYEEVCLGR